jgi:hypothetical protein
MCNAPQRQNLTVWPVFVIMLVRSPVAQLAECPAVYRLVGGSNPSRGAKCRIEEALLLLLRIRTAAKVIQEAGSKACHQPGRATPHTAFVLMLLSSPGKLCGGRCDGPDCTLTGDIGNPHNKTDLPLIAPHPTGSPGPGSAGVLYPVDRPSMRDQCLLNKAFVKSIWTYVGRARFDA